MSMRVIFKPLFFAILILLSGLVEAERRQLPAYSQAYDPKRDPFKDGREAIELAASTQRRVLIEIGGDWCSWCMLLDRTIKQNAQLSEALHSRFVLLKVNMSGANDNWEFLKDFPIQNGYPQLFVTNAKGQILYNKDPGEFYRDGEYAAELILEFLEEWGPKRSRSVANQRLE